MVSVVLALAAAMSWGISDFLGGFNARRMALTFVVLASQLVGIVVLLPLAVLHGAPRLEPVHVLLAACGSLAGIVGIAALYRGMAVGMVSVVAPISAAGAALPVLVGLARGERTSLTQAIGIVLALLGIVLASLVTDAEAGKRRVGAGVGLALLAALGFGLFFLLLHEASTRDVLWAAVVQRTTGTLVMIPFALIVRPSLVGVRSRLLSLCAAGALDTGANALFAAASVSGLASIAAVLASLYPVVTVVLAGLVLRERLTRAQTLGVTSALVGVACIASSS